MKVYKDIVEIEVDRITPYWRNPRNNDKTVLRLMEIIPEIGFNVPLLVDKNYVIIKGHSRYNAGKRLGMKTLPCIVSEEDDSTNAKNRVYDNAVAELSDWDIDKLKVEIENKCIDLSQYKVPSLENKVFHAEPKKQPKDILMRYICPCCKKEILISRNEVLSK